MGSQMWQIASVEEIYRDRNFRVTLVRDKVERTVYFYHKVEVGDIVSLDR